MITAVTKLQWAIAVFIVIVALVTLGGWGNKTDDPEMNDLKRDQR